jgi:hypothetical protein
LVRLAIALAVLAGAITLGGCSLGAEESQKGGASMVVTRDYGSQRILRDAEDPIPGGETVMRFLMRNADVDTRYGGRFVNAIEGTRSATRGGHRFDWFYYVNGIEADTGAAERRVHPSDRVWWDYRDWSAAMRVPAVVGSYPEPFRHGSDGKRFPVRVDCAPDAQDQCDAVRKRLDQVNVDSNISVLGTAVGKDTLRFIVGTWNDVRRDAAARKIEDGPGESGVFARPTRSGDSYELDLLDEEGRVARTLGAGAALVAATRFEDQQPTWTIAGMDKAGLERAVALLTPAALRDHYAVAVDGRESVPLPVLRGGEG